ncbi:MAG: glucose 1-dehydrogenase [Gammaproteobacteria bacterium]|nr:glucose 1-dehydrogenase [Gammaproteobacteria bacterium]
MGRLDDKVCLITGAARGQGEAEARLFANEGATVWLTDVLDGPGESTAGAIGGTYRHLDVRAEAEWSALVAQILEAHGKIDALINNAGIFATGRHYEIELEEFTRIMDVNCVGVFLGMRAVSPAMRDAGSGSIVNISSLAGLTGGNGAFAYHTSKWAVRGMTKAAAVENGRRNVRVNSIHPGLIDTDMMQQLPGAEDETRLTRRIPLGRAAQADEVAQLALYLASDESSYSTGSEFIVDGGLNAM